MMTGFLAAAFAAPVAGLAAALIVWGVRGRHRGLLPGMIAVTTAIAGTLGVLGDLVPRVLGAGSVLVSVPMPPALAVWLFDLRYTIPLVTGAVGLVLLAFPIRRRRGSGSADLTPRSPLTFAKGWWFVPPAIALAIVLVVTFAAGAASQPDPATGRHDQYLVDGGAMSVSTHIYGWYYSVPALIALTAMILLVCADLLLIARAPLAEDRDADAGVRSVRVRNVLAAATGALLLHLAAVCGSLSATASVRGNMTTVDGPMFLWSPMAAFEQVFLATAYLATAGGIAVWALVALSALPARRRALAPVAA